MSRHTQEEIAKQFDLPERQSKIDTLLREPEIYCICRSSDSTRFMIACDACEEWYHGDCVNITQSDANNIHHYYCQWCIEKDPILEIEYKKKSSSGHSKDKHQVKGERKAGRPKKNVEKILSDEKPEKSKSKKGCGFCSGCTNRRDCGRCENCKKNRKKDKDRKKKICSKRVCVMDTVKKEKEKDTIQRSMKEEASTVLTSKQLFTVVDDEEEDDWMPPQLETTKATSSKKQSSARRTKKKMETKSRKQRVLKSERQRHRSESSEEESDDPVQCYWYDCCNEAQPNSKYCSDECGVRIATDRIMRLLPGRIQEWNLTPCLAEENNKKELDSIRRKQAESRGALEELESKRIALDAHIEKIQRIEINPDSDEEEQEEEEGSIYCVTCGHEVPIKSCIKHMERCYNKYESQTSFGSAFKTGLEGTPIFCDFYHLVNRTYCKRLKVLCPEHCKDPKIKDTAICGYPISQIFTGPTDQICRIIKKKCNKHHCWEKLRRAEIDLEKVRYWLKLDELYEQERQVKQALTNRAGVLGLLLHSTFDHEVREKIQKQFAEAEMKQKLAEEQQERERLERESEASIDFDDFDVQVQSEHSKSREHRKSHHTNRSSETAEEMTASKLYKINTTK